MTYKMRSGEDFAVQTKGGGRIIVPNVVAEPQFDQTAAYAEYAKVWYGNVQYVCKSATTAPEEGQSNPIPGEDSAHWTEIPVEEMAKKSEVVKIPVYDGSAARHEFLDAAVSGSAISGFKTTGTVHSWTAQRRCTVYMCMTASANSTSVVYVCVNDQTANDTSHMLFKHALAAGTGMVVPVFLNEGDTLDMRITDSSLSQLQYSVFYID